MTAMKAAQKSKKMKKELGLLDVYAIATGTTLSAGFFLLPGIAIQDAGPAMVLSYLLAVFPLIPAMLSITELATAMPRAGGAYYFLDRSMGPLVGTVGGLGSWIGLTLKVAFSLVGMGAYINLFVPGDHQTVIAVAFAILFGLVNLRPAKHAGSVQLVLVISILLLIAGFIARGLFQINLSHFHGFFNAGAQPILATAGAAFLSFAGITKITSLSEEIKDPERNLPLGIFLSFTTALCVYGLGMFVLVGVLPASALSGNLTPMASAAELLLGTPGKFLMILAAILAFSSITNAALLSSSRFPLAMSRDHLLPMRFRRLTPDGTPRFSVMVTVGLLIAMLVFFDAAKIAKLASAFQMLILALCCLAVIIMRESKIGAYDPGYRSPFYPWMHLFGFFLPQIMIYEMGFKTLLFTAGLILLGVVWFFTYARHRVARGGAIFHVFERWGEHRYDGLEPELRSILKEKGLRDKDPFDELVSAAHVIDFEDRERFDTIIRLASERLAADLDYTPKELEENFLQGTKIGATPVSKGIALPHMRLKNLDQARLLLVRARHGLRVDMDQDFWGEHRPQEEIYALFFLISPDHDPSQHLRILAKIAERVDDDNFMEAWKTAPDTEKLKEVLLEDERLLSLTLHRGTFAASYIGKRVRELSLPHGCLIGMIHRNGELIIPDGNTVLLEDDRLTIIGSQKSIAEFRHQ